LVKRLPLYGRWLWATLAVLAAAALFVRLGFWQLDRLSQRRAANAHLLARLNQPALVLDATATGIGALDPETVDLRRATVRGTYDYTQEIVLRNRALNGVPGVHLITPLHIENTDAAVLVDRGWMPFDGSAPINRSGMVAEAGMVEVRGILHRSQTRLNALSPADPPLGPNRPRLDEWFRVDIPRIQEQVPYRLLRVYLEVGEYDPAAAQTGLPSTTSTALPRPDIEIDLSDGPHLSYAIQWFAFATIALGGYAALYYQRELKPHAPQRDTPYPDPLA
jgi:surfeit locus 1 family protein